LGVLEKIPSHQLSHSPLTPISDDRVANLFGDGESNPRGEAFARAKKAVEEGGVVASPLLIDSTKFSIVPEPFRETWIVHSRVNLRRFA